MLDVRLEGKSPIYEQLFDGIARQINTGALRANERLPAVREVAKQLGINPNTVQKTYGLLEQAGLIYSIPAKGSYVSSGVEASAALHADALRKLEAAMTAARRGGISLEETKDMAEKIWSEERNEN